MPPAATANWEDVKATAIATGSLIDAAEHHGLKYETVRSRASREEWPVGRRVMQQLKAAQDAAHTQVQRAGKASVVSVKTSATSATEAISSVLEEDGRETRLALSKVARRSAEHAKTMTGKELIATSDKLLNVGKLAALTHGWNKDDAGGSRINVNLLCQNVGNLQITADQ